MPLRLKFTFSRYDAAAHKFKMFPSFFSSSFTNMAILSLLRENLYLITGFLQGNKFSKPEHWPSLNIKAINNAKSMNISHSLSPNEFGALSKRVPPNHIN